MLPAGINDLINTDEQAVGSSKARQVESSTEDLPKVFDGEKVVSLKDEKFSIRKQALWNGVLMASIVLDNRGNLISVPILTELGISKTEKMKNALLEISLKIEDYIEGLNETDSLDEDNLKEILKKIILKEIRILFSIRPLVNIHINRVQ